MKWNKQEISEVVSLIRQLDTSIAHMFESSIGISLTRYELMQALLRNGGEVTQVYLQNELDIDRAAVTRHLKILEEKGYINKQRNPDNNREMMVSLSEAGQQVLTGCNHEHDQFVKDLLTGITCQDVKHLVSILHKLKQNAAKISERE